jgi:hypothetical protein
MATSVPRLGLRHVTVVPANYAPEVDAEEDGAATARRD